MTWILVLAFLAGPLEGQTFEYKPDRRNTHHFTKLEDCKERAQELGPTLELEFRNGGAPQLNHPFTLACVRVKGAVKA